MLAFAIRRLVEALMVMLAVALIAFLLFRYVGDPVHQMVGQDTSLEDRLKLRQELGLTLLFILNTLGIGLLVSTLVQNQQQAMMGAVFGAMVPMLYLSGLIFPIENMPPAIQAVTYAIPLRYFAEIIRGVFLRGSGLSVLWPEAVTLLLMGVATLTLAALRFRKRLD